MFMFDIETLGIESTTIILSAAIIHFDFSDRDMPSGLERFHDFVERSCFVKFDARQQGDKYKRTMTPSTLEWWKQQSQISREVSLNPSKKDVSVLDGIATLKDYIARNGGDQQIVWARGSLDQMAIDSLCRAAEVEPLFHYSKWRDVRTAVDLLANTENGYCMIENFNPDLVAVKHDPRVDCAIDAMMLLYYK